MESNIKGLVAAGHEMASELKAECGAVDMRSVAKLISDLATQLEVQLVRANALAEDQQKAIESIKQADAAVKLAHEKFSALAAENAGLKAFKFLTGPETVLALLDERERNQQYIKRRDQENEDIALTVGKLRVELEEAKSKLNEQREYYEGVISDGSKRIAELEAREIKPAKGEVLVVVSGFTGCGKSAIAGEIEIAMKAIGVPVKWTNGDAEKRMTGADWLTAIEMYKPTVRIVEVNVPRAAGIKEESE
ncbi:TPA: ead/Ea22-like family protein [Escherichia coli]